MIVINNLITRRITIMELSILNKLTHNDMGTPEVKPEKPYVPPPYTSREDWFKWYSGIYLKSSHWEKVREYVLKRDKYRCRFCGCSGNSSNPLQCHHRDYESLYTELEDDSCLVTLCKRCHKAAHKYMKK